MRNKQSILIDKINNDIEKLKIKIEYLFHQQNNQNVIKIFDNDLLKNTNNELITINKSFENILNCNEIENISFINNNQSNQVILI